MSDENTWGHRLAEKLKGKSVGRWNIQGYLGAGRSAAVLLALDTDANEQRALKLYDPEFISDKEQAQVERDRRQLVLKDHACRTLVKTFEVGKCDIDGTAHHFTLMEYIAGIDLRRRIEQEAPNEEEIRTWLGHLLDAVDELRQRDIFHRDIKPENIRIRDNGELVLLDLGVLKLRGQAELTDHGQGKRPFVGSLRYAPPELLLRREGHDATAWDAITLYQIGTVLYEMIDGRWIFDGYKDPFAELALAVLHYNPVLSNPRGLPTEFVSATAACLVKDPETRLEAVSYDALRRIAKGEPGDADLGARMEAVRRHFALNRQLAEEKILAPRRQEKERAEGVEQTNKAAYHAIHAIVEQYLKDVRGGAGTPAGAEGGGVRYVSVIYDRGLERSIPGGFRLLIWILPTQDPNVVRLEGAGMWTLRILQDRVDSERGRLQKVTGRDQIYVGPWNKSAVEEPVIDWITRMEAKYLEAVEPYLKQLIDIESKGEKTIKRSPEGNDNLPTVSYWFTTQVQNVLA